MPPEKQRIAIAEVCGWKPSQPRGKWCHPANLSMAKSGSYEVWVGRDKLPDYINDLNACHEMEKMLTRYQRQKHGDILQSILDETAVGYVTDYKSQLAGLSRVASADAAQRCEAFLRTLNLYTT